MEFSTSFTANFEFYAAKGLLLIALCLAAASLSAERMVVIYFLS